MNDASELETRIVSSLVEIPATAWDACAAPAGLPFNPFVSHAFLHALEASGCVAPATGWAPRHLIAETAGGTLVGAMPLYLKTHSLGEYVFDQSWANAYEAAGGHYYPKLLCAVPFTPVPSPRLLAAPTPQGNAAARLLLQKAMELTRGNGLSSLHVNFIAPEQLPLFDLPELLLREGRQFHFDNPGYASFDDFLASLNARKRKAVRRERREALAAGLDIRRLEGREIQESHWDAFFSFYQDTGARKWGSPYLNRRFFSHIGEAMAERILLLLAYRAGQPIAGALNFIGGDTLYGRYWGMSEFHSSLHFELCYYQAIEFAIDAKLERVEAGAQGEHKLARGYLPTPTYSVHYLPDRQFRQAAQHFISRERAHIELEHEALSEHSPFRRDADDNEE